MKIITVSKLELQAVVLVTRLAKYVGEALRKKLDGGYSGQTAPACEIGSGLRRLTTNTRPGKQNSNNITTRSVLETKYLIPETWMNRQNGRRVYNIINVEWQMY